MFILPPNSFQVFTLKHPSALDGHTHSTVPTHTVPKHAGPSGHSFIPWVGTPHVCTPHTVPSTIVNFHGHAHTCICPMPMGHHHPPSTSFSTSSPLISCGPHYPCHMPAPLWPGVSSMLQLGRSFGGVG